MGEEIPFHFSNAKEYAFYEFEKKYCKLHALLPKEVSSNLKSQEIHLQNYIANP